MTTDSRLRLRIMGVVIVSLLSVLIARLWYLQTLTREENQAVAESQYLREVFEPAPRGNILDVNGKVLVRNKLVTVVTIDKGELEQKLPLGRRDADRREMLEKLAVRLSRSGNLTKVADLEAKLASSEFQNLGEVRAATDVDPNLLIYFAERQDEFPGVRIKQATVRDYPYGGLAAHVLGYVGRVDEREYNILKDRWADDDPDGKPYLRTDEVGKTGVEKLFEDELRGVPARRVYEVDRSGRVIRERDELGRAPRPGNDVVLTIDIDIQALVEQELAEGLRAAREQEPDPNDPDAPETIAAAGAAVITNPQTGAILAMASYPTYEPQSFIGGISQAEFARLTDKASYQPILNRAIQGLYSPGSTFKAFTAYAAMHRMSNPYPLLSPQGLGFGPDFPRDDPGSYTIPDPPCRPESGSCTFRNPDEQTHEDVDLRRALTVSSNSYFYEIGANFSFRNDFDSETIQAAAELFGFGRATGVGLPGERGGIIPTAALFKQRHQDNPTAFPRGELQTGDTVNLSVGQGDLLVTPLQLTNAYATLANGGTLLAPNIATRVVDADDNIVRLFAPRPIGEVDLPESIRQPILDGLLGVTRTAGPKGDRGTAYAAFNLPAEGGVDFGLPDWPVAGKTGTEEVQGKADSAWFVAFGPTPDPAFPGSGGNKPAYAMTAMLEQSGWGGEFAAPVVARVFQALKDGAVPHQYSSDEVAACFRRLLAQNPALASVANGLAGQQGLAVPSSTRSTRSTTTTSTTTTTRPASTVPRTGGLPSLAELCPL